jgi:putative endonuclease
VTSARRKSSATAAKAKAKPWFVYVLRCGDGSLYTGATNDLARRVARHGAGLGARYTRSRLPVELVLRERCADRSAALRREAAIKRLRRAEKLDLVASRARSRRRRTPSAA